MASAYVTFLEGKNGGYLKGVQALARSLAANCRYPLIVATAPTVPLEFLTLLRQEPNVEVRQIDWLPLPAALRSEIYANGQFINNFTKLRLFEFVDLKKAVYLDADTCAFANLDDMFLAPSFSAVLDNMSADDEFTLEKFQIPGLDQLPSFEEPQRSYFNAGVFVFSPSLETFRVLFKKLETWQPTRFAEQDFLNDFYRGKWNALPLSYNFGKPNFWLAPDLCTSISMLKVVHFSGRAKPWDRLSDGTWPSGVLEKALPLERNALVGPDASALLKAAVDKWQYYFNTGIPVPDLTPPTPPPTPTTGLQWATFSAEIKFKFRYSAT